MTSIKRQNPFDPLYKLQDIRASELKLEDLPEFPRILDVELTNACNFKCLMCPTGAGTSSREQGFMKEEDFYRILDEAKEYNTSIRFTVWGEPLLHHKIIDFVKAIKSEGMMCHINTNGKRLSDKRISAFVEIPLDSIKFSMQGVDKDTFAEMRNIDYFDGLLVRIKRLYQARGNGLLPYIHIGTSITDETVEQCYQLKEMTSNICDYLSIGRTHFEFLDGFENSKKLKKKEKERLKNLIPKQTIKKEHLDCPEVFSKLTVYWDGRVTACCTDYDNLMPYGNIFDKSLKDIWHSSKANFYRKMLHNMRHPDLPLCSKCFGKLHQHPSPI